MEWYQYVFRTLLVCSPGVIIGWLCFDTSKAPTYMEWITLYILTLLLGYALDIRDKLKKL